MRISIAINNMTRFGEFRKSCAICGAVLMSCLSLGISLNLGDEDRLFANVPGPKLTRFFGMMLPFNLRAGSSIIEG